MIAILFDRMRCWIRFNFTLTLPLSLRDCVIISISRQNVMLNLFQHLIKSICYETLKRVQGDKKWITTQSLKGEGNSNYFLSPAGRGLR